LKKIRLVLILLISAFCLISCNHNTETPEDQKNLDTPMLKIEDNILTFTDKFTFQGISTSSKIAVGIKNKNETWEYAKQFLYTSDFSFNIDNEIFSTIVKATKSLPTEEKITITILNVNNNWEYICHTDVNYIPNSERIAVFDYSKKTFTPKQMTFTEESAWNASTKMKNGANISNDLDCVVKGLKEYDLPPIIWEEAWSATPVTLENIRYLKSLGFNAIRLPVSWAQHLDSNNNVYASWMNRVQEVVDWCMDEDLYVIMNTHHDGGPKNEAEGSSWIRATEESYNASKDLYVKILIQICDRFKNYSEKLIFANVNEVCPGDVIPNDSSKVPDSAFRAMEKWNQLFVDTVRNSGGNNSIRNISVSSVATAYDSNALSRIQLPIDSAKNHLLFEVHCYDPWTFCGHGDECTVSEFDKSGFDINRALVPSFEFSETHNVPVYIGEWGVFDYTNEAAGISKIVSDEDRVKYVNQFISYATKHGLTPFIWLPCAYTGYTSEKDAEHYCPKFIKAIQDNIFPSEYDPELFGKETKYTLKKDYKWDASIGAQSTTEYDLYGIRIDLTESFSQLPVAGNTVSVTYNFVSDKDISDLYFYYVDTSSAANSFWLKLDGDYETVGHIQNIKAGTKFTLAYNPTLVTSPEGNVTLWINYPKTVLDEEITLTVKKN